MKLSGGSHLGRWGDLWLLLSLLRNTLEETGTGRRRCLYWRRGDNRCAFRTGRPGLQRGRLSGLRRHLRFRSSHRLRGTCSGFCVSFLSTIFVSPILGHMNVSTYALASKSSPPRLKMPNCMPTFSSEVKLPLGMMTAWSALNLCRRAAEVGRVCCAGVVGLTGAGAWTASGFACAGCT